LLDDFGLGGEMMGIELRDLLAALAMHAMVSSHDVTVSDESDALTYKAIAEMSYFYADEMIEERTRYEQTP